MSKRVEILDSVKSSDADVAIVSQSLVEYTTAPIIDDLTDETLPAWKNVKDYVSLGQPVQIPFTSTDPGIIDWQTDIPAGYTDTYANLLGNYFPRPVIAVLMDTDGITGKKTYAYPGGAPVVVRNADDTIDTVTFDFTVGDGFVRF